jgi:hypothetical protein
VLSTTHAVLGINSGSHQGSWAYAFGYVIIPGLCWWGYRWGNRGRKQLQFLGGVDMLLGFLAWIGVISLLAAGVGR